MGGQTSRSRTRALGVTTKSTLGHSVTLDSPVPERTRVRATIAVGRSGDYSLIRRHDGTVDTLEDIAGEPGDLMRSLIERVGTESGSRRTGRDGFA